jgi:hypothetical protein
MKSLPPNQKVSETCGIIRSKYFWYGSLLAFSVLIILFFLEKSLIFQGNRIKAVINEREFKLEVASDDGERKKGLGGRERICENCGMIFQFPVSGNYSFWMKDMKFSLDIIWILENKVVYIAKNIPFDYRENMMPEVWADKVLELNAGTCDRNNIKEGDIVNF